MAPKLIRKLASTLAPLTVCASFDGATFYHKSWSRRDALEWLACYPLASRVVVRDRFFRVIGRRV